MSFFAAVLLLATAIQQDRTSWMNPASFHLTVGMPRTEAIEALRAWSPKPGASADELVIDYGEDKALTLQFHRGRLKSVRFELFVFLPETRKAFEEARAALRAIRGEPRTSGRSVLVYDEALPNIMLVVSDDPKSTQGKKGLGIVASRWYDPR